MLKFQQVTVRQGKNDIVKDISFTVHKGKITVLLGKNGSGKTTLLRAANGLLRYEGQIVLDGHPLPMTGRARLAAFLPQILPETDLSVREVVSLGRHPYTGLFGKLSREDEAIVDRVMEQMSLRDFATRRTGSLSGGERQRVFLAQLLAQQTPLLVLDEPTAFMDPDAAAALDQLCNRLRTQGKTVLAVMHDLGRAVALADHIVVLDEGRVAFEGSREDCLDRAILEHTFGVRRVAAEQRIFFI
ncbi:MAG: ABC transporter ATP-binding protein [Clostridia bacterium]|nr:ABC transporter ATP-binding protein [Clostridia bacterium]